MTKRQKWALDMGLDSYYSGPGTQGSVRYTYKHRDRIYWFAKKADAQAAADLIGGDPVREDRVAI